MLARPSRDALAFLADDLSHTLWYLEGVRGWDTDSESCGRSGPEMVTCNSGHGDYLHRSLLYCVPQLLCVITHTLISAVLTAELDAAALGLLRPPRR